MCFRISEDSVCIKQMLLASEELGLIVCGQSQHGKFIGGDCLDDAAQSGGNVVAAELLFLHIKNVEESAEAEVADRVTVKAKGRIVHCLTRQSVYLETVVVRCPKRNSLFKTIGRIPTIEKK